jgi:hypothetical protein
MSPQVASRLSVSAFTMLALACTPAQVRYTPTLTPPPGGTPTATLFLVGDAGEINEHSTAVLAHLRENIASVVDGGPARPIVVAYLGDNLYEVGARAENEGDLAILEAQADALGNHPEVRGVFIPGNHDWSRGGADDIGRQAVRLQQDWVGRLGATTNIDLLPADACPGPAGLDVGASVRLVFVDTEWLLRQPEDDCGSADAFYQRLATDLQANRSKQIVVLSHHPLASGGVHAGHVAPFERGPFVYYLLIKSGVSAQDLASGGYSEMITRLERAFESSGVRPLFHAAGHDHSLQVIRRTGAGRPAYQLVSGAGSRSTHSRRIEGTRYATDGYGYMRVDFLASGAHVTVYARDPEGGPLRPVFACPLSPATVVDTCSEAPLQGDDR